MQDTIRLTVAQAIVRWLMNQFIEIDGVDKPAAVAEMIVRVIF